MSIIAAALWKAWAFILPIAGPLLARAAPFLAWVPGVAAITKSLRVASYVAVLGFGAWGATKAIRWWDGDKITVAEAQQRAAVASREAEVEAKAKALAEREAALSQRVQAVEAAAAELDQLKSEMDDARTQSLAAGQPIGADDRWLLDWTRRGR